MTETEVHAHAHPEYGLIASDEMQQARKERIGKTPLNRDRGATTADHVDPDTLVVGERVEKDAFADDDIREITVSEIDEKMLDLEEADQNNPATTKSHNDLRDLKAAIVSLNRDPGLSFYGAALERVTALREEGKDDEADVMQAAADLLRETSSRPYEGVDYTREDYKAQNAAIVKENIVQHNDRVARNKSRQSAPANA
jgi:hypothetical protein